MDEKSIKDCSIQRHSFLLRKSLSCKFLKVGVRQVFIYLLFLRFNFSLLILATVRNSARLGWSLIWSPWPFWDPYYCLLWDFEGDCLFFVVCLFGFFPSGLLQEWHLKCSHYFVLTASKGMEPSWTPLLSNMTGTYWLVFVVFFYVMQASLRGFRRQ